MARRARGSASTRVRRVRFAALALALLAGGAGTAQEGAIAFAIKATFLVRFGDYVGWPPDAFATPGSAVTMCVVGDDPFGSVLDDVVAGATAAGRPLRVVRLDRVSAESGCHLAYLSGSPAQSVAEALEAIGDASMLTITDSAFVDGVRGAIHFVVADDRVRFHIDEAAAAERGLTLSARLLSVAMTVRRRSPP